MTESNNRSARPSPEEIQKKLARLEKSERHFRAIYEQAPLGITLVEFDTGQFVRWNPKFCEIVQRRPEELEHLDFQSLTHPEDLPENLRGMEELRTGRSKSFKMEKRYLLPDGGHVWIHLTIVPMWLEGERPDYYIAMIEDVSARKKTEEKLARQADFDQLITRILGRFASSIGLGIDDSIRESLREVAVFIGAEAAYVNMASEDFSSWTSAYEVVSPGVGRAAHEYRHVPTGTYPWTEQRVLAGEAVAIRTLDDFPPEAYVDRAMYAGEGVQSILLVPLRCGCGRIAGLIELRSYSHTLTYSDEDVRRFRTVGDAITNTLERKRVENALYDSRQMLQQVLDAIPQRVFWKDRDLNFLGCNIPFASDANLIEVREVIGKNDFEMPWGHDFAEMYRADDRQVIETGTPKLGFEEPQIRQDGTRCWLRTNKVPLRDGEGNIFGILGTYEDITEFRNTREALSKAKDAAEAANRAKDQFIAVLSHELRTPLTPVMAVVSALQELGGLPLRLRGDVEMIRRNVELEARLIDDLLDATRLSQGKIVLHREPVDINECLRSAEGFCENGIASKYLKFELKTEARKPYVWGDPVRLRQVFWNLLQNAVKFTPEHGKIEIRSFNEEGRVKVVIADSGIGIEPEAMKRIFNPFEQGEKTWTRRFGGLGLGLSIAKGLVDLHEGNIVAESAGKDQGAVFTVDLPLAKSAAFPVKAPLPQGRVVRGTTRILLVDDHLDTLRILARLLRRWGYTVATAETVKAAMERAGEEPFDILISDLGLPDGSGRDIMSAMKGQSTVRGIALSGFGTDDDIRSSMEAGFDEHLTKPVSFQALQMAVQRLGARANTGPVRHKAP